MHLLFGRAHLSASVWLVGGLRFIRARVVLRAVGLAREKGYPAMSSLAPLESIKPDNYPRLSREGLGALKFNWRKANVKDDWTKGGRLSDAWDRVSGWPYWKKPSYDLDYCMRIVAKIAQEIPAW